LSLLVAITVASADGCAGPAAAATDGRMRALMHSSAVGEADGARYVWLIHPSVVRVLDAARGRWFTYPMPACSLDLRNADPVVYVHSGLLYDIGCRHRVVDLRSGRVVARLVAADGYPELPEDYPSFWVPYFGRRWFAFEDSSGAPSLFFSWFSLHHRRRVEPPTSLRATFDPDRRQPVVRLCPPLTRVFDQEAANEIDPFLYDDGAAVTTTDATLLDRHLVLERCHRPTVTLSDCPNGCFNVQLGAGIATWDEQDGKAHIVDVWTGRERPMLPSHLGPITFMTHTRHLLVISNYTVNGRFTTTILATRSKHA
jgi:hypothetical protein